MKDHFWEVSNKIPLSALPVLEETEEDENQHLTLLIERRQGEYVDNSSFNFEDEGKEGRAFLGWHQI